MIHTWNPLDEASKAATEYPRHNLEILNAEPLSLYIFPTIVPQNAFQQSQGNCSGKDYGR